MSSGYQEPAGGTASPSTGTAVGSKPIRAWLKVLRNVDIVAEPDYGSNFIPRLKTPFELLSTSLRLHNPAQTFYTNVESAALLANQSIKVPIITATESGNKKDEVVLLKQGQSLENKTFPTFYDITETAAPANPSAGTIRIYANSTTHDLTQRNSAGVEKGIGSGGGGGGAPTTVPYLTLATDATLTTERVLTASSRISITDAGAGSTATLDVTAGSIVDSQIGSHTSTKISITAKGQLNSQIAYTDQNNIWGNNDNTFRSGKLWLSNPANTFFYQFVGGAITTPNKVITYPVLTGNDEPVFVSHAVTLANKSISGSTNTITNVGDSAISSHTSTKISITAKGQLNSQIAYKDENNWITNSHVADGTLNWAKTSKTGSILDDLGDVVITSAASQDIITRNGSSQWINLAKGSNNTVLTINGSGNLAYATVADANIASHTSTKITITAKGQLNSAILYNDQNNSFGAFYHDITEIAAPANPAAGTLRIYTNSTTHELTQRDSTGAEKKMSDGSGGGGAPTTSQYLTLATDGSLTNERVLTASSRVTLTDAGAGSTATLDIGAGTVVDSQIGTHTSTKISITAKGQLNSQIGYKDETLWLTNAMIAAATIDLAAKGVKGSGTALQVLRVNTGATALEWATPSSGSTTPYMTAADYTVTKEGANYNAYASLGTSAAFTNTALHTLIASIVTALGATGGVIEFARNTEFLTATQIVLANKVILRGQDRVTSIIKSTGTNKIFNYDTGSGGAQLTDAGIENLHLISHDGIAGDAEALYCSGSLRFKFNRNWVESKSEPTVATIMTFFDTKFLVNFHNQMECKDNWYSGDAKGQDAHGSGNMYNCICTGNTFFNLTGQAFGSANPYYTIFANNTFINTGKPIGFETLCEFNIIANNQCYNTGPIKLSGESSNNISRYNSVYGNIMVYGIGGIEMGNSYYDEVYNNKIIRTQRWGIYGSGYRCTIRNNLLVDTNHENSSQTINSTSQPRGGITLFNNTTNQPDSDENIIEQNRLIDTGATFVDPVSTLTKNGNTGPVVIDTNYDKTKILNNNYSGLVGGINVVNFGTHTFLLQTEAEVLQVHSDEADQFQLYRMVGTNNSRAGIRVDMNDSAGARAQYGAADFIIADNTDTSKDSYFGVKYQVNNTLTERFYAYNNHIGFGAGGSTSVELRSTGITGGLKVFTYPNASGETAVVGVNINDAAISAHTSTKITITAKGQLNSSILYSDIDNSLGAHYFDIDEIAAPGSPAAGKLRIYADSTSHVFSQKNSGGTVIKMDDGSAGGGGAPTTASYLTLGTDATLTNERVLTASSRVTLTDAGAGSTATLDIGAGTIVDSQIGSHTSTKVSITAKGQLNSAIVYNDAANVFGDFNNTFRSGKLRLSNPANTFFYNWTGGAIAADRTINMPVLTANDEPLFKDFAATVTNKSISGSTNTVTNIGDSAISSHTSTKITITTKGQLNSAILYNDVDNSLGAHYLDIGEIAAPSAPGANLLRLYMDSSDESLRWKNSGNTVFNLNSISNSMIANTTIDLQAKGVKGSGTGLQVLRVNSGATALEWATLDNQRVGKSTANGGGSSFNIAHGLGATPTYVFCQMYDPDIMAIKYTWDGTNISVTTASNTTAGTNNVKFVWTVIA